MELGGEVIAGHFFAGLSAPQFADPAALRVLERAGVTPGPPFWCSAIDPVSPCGLIESDAPRGWPIDLPRRALGNHLAFRGSELIMVSEARGRRLRIALPPDDPDIEACFAPLAQLLLRTGQRSRQIEVETINGMPATASAYVPALRSMFDVLIDHRQVTLRQRFS